jgi:hypothetical protein
MPSERILIGGGTGYDNSSVESKYRSYYQFRTYDIYEIVGNPQVRNGSLLATYYNSDDTRISNTYTILTNRLFTGVLPYTDPYDKNYYCQTLNLPPLVPNYLPALSTYNAANEIFFTFGLPVTLTKYRIWNGFANGTSGQTSANMGLDTPRSWVLYGSNDYINWTEVDSRSNQSPLSYATGKLCKDSPYSEYSITAPSAYKIYKLSVTVGASNSSLAFNCNKSGCNYFYGWQIGELQLWGYESPMSSCSLHGYDTLLPGTSGSMSKLFGLKNACKEVGINEGFSAAPNNDNFGYLSRSWEYFSDWTYSNIYYSILDQTRAFRANYYGPNPNVVIISSSIDMGQALTITSYNMLGAYLDTDGWYRKGDGSPKNWTLYGSNNNSTWTTIDSITNASLTYTAYSNYSIGSPASYRYYKLEVKGGGGVQTGNCDKGGCWYALGLNDLQFIGAIS